MTIRTARGEKGVSPRALIAANEASRPAVKKLFLGGYLGVGIAPSAQFQAAADPAQAFGGDGRAFLAADDAAGGLFHAVRFDGKAGLLDDGVGRRRFHDGDPRQRRFAFLLHIPTISS